MEKLAKLVLLTSTMVGYSYLTEFFMAWYGPSKFERDLFWCRATGHYWWAFWIMFICNVIFPLLAVVQAGAAQHAGAVRALPVRQRRHVVRALRDHRHVARASVRSRDLVVHYRMSWTEAAIIAGSFAWFFMFFLIFVRVLPAFSIAEIKETLPLPMRRKRGMIDALLDLLEKLATGRRPKFHGVMGVYLLRGRRGRRGAHAAPDRPPRPARVLADSAPRDRDGARAGAVARALD